MKIKTVRPIGERVLVQPLPEEAETAGGILKPDISIEKPVMGKVVELGSIFEGRGPAGIQKDAVLLYGKFSGTEILVDGKAHVILNLDEVLAIVEL